MHSIVYFNLAVHTAVFPDNESLFDFYDYYISNNISLKAFLILLLKCVFLPIYFQQKTTVLLQ